MECDLHRTNPSQARDHNRMIYLMHHPNKPETLSAIQHWSAARTLHHIVSSRAAHTHATQVAAPLSLAVQVDDDWRDIDRGSITDDLWLQGIYERWLSGESDAAFVGGDTFASVYQRVQLALYRLPADQKTLVISHGDLIRSVIPYLCVNAAALQVRDALAPGAFVTLERYDARRFVCWSWNKTDHLPNS